MKNKDFPDVIYITRPEDRSGFCQFFAHENLTYSEKIVAVYKLDQIGHSKTIFKEDTDAN